MEDHTPDALRARVERFREMATEITDPKAIEALLELVSAYDAQAAELEKGASPTSDE